MLEIERSILFSRLCLPFIIPRCLRVKVARDSWLPERVSRVLYRTALMARAPRHLSSPPSPPSPPPLAQDTIHRSPSHSIYYPLPFRADRLSLLRCLTRRVALSPFHSHFLPTTILTRTLSPSLVPLSFNSSVLLPRITRLRFFLLRAKESSLCPAVLHCFLRFHLPAVFAFSQSLYRRFLIVLREHEIDFSLYSL